MKRKRPQRKSTNPGQLMSIVKAAELESDTEVSAIIQEAMLTQDWSELEYFIQDQMPVIQERIMLKQYEAQKTEADPFYPRPAIDEFSGNIPIAIIPDHFEQPPGMFIIDINDLMQHTFFCGSSGSGKSRAELSIIRTLKADLGDKLTIWVFEPKKSFRKFLFPDFKIFTFQDMRDNLFEPPTPKMEAFTWRRIVAELLGREQQFQIASKNQLIETLLALEKDKKKPSSDQILKKLREDFKDAGSYRESDPIQSLINRFSALVEYDDHSRKVHIPTEDLMHMDMVIELGDSNTENERFRIGMLLSRLYHYKKHHQDGHYNLVVIDEGRELFGNTSTGFGESILEGMFALAREMDIGFIVSTQEPKSVSTAIKSNVHTMIAFPLSEGKERKDVSMSLSLIRPQMEYYQQLSSLGYGNAIVKYGGIPEAFPVQFPNVPDPDRMVTQQEIDLHNDELLEQYKIPDAPAKPQAPPKPPPLISKDEEKLMRTIYKNPLLPITKMYKECGLNPKIANNIKAGLLKKGYLEQGEVKIKKKGRANVFMRLTPDAHKRLGIKSNAWNKPGIKHEIYCRLVRLKLEDEGWNCELEGQTGSHSHKMDVLAIKDGQKYDYEITIHRKNMNDNIKTALNHNLAHKVIIIADDDELDKCRAKAGELIDKYGDALEFTPISDFYID